MRPGARGVCPAAGPHDNTKGKQTMKHMDERDRGRIEFLAGCRSTCEQIAMDLGRSPSTIRDELQKRRVASDKRYGCSNRLCAHYDECTRSAYTATGECRRRNTPKCIESCPDFREAVCHRLARFPFVCNGCEKEHNCPLPKKFYVASAAQTAYESLRSLSRSGVRPDEAQIKEMDAVLSPSLRKGQSVTAVVRANAAKFAGYATSTVYGWLHDGLFSARGSDLPYAGRSRKPRKRPETKTNALCRLGRTIREMWEWLKLHIGIVPCELDTVVGSISGKVVYTMIFPKSGLALGFLRDQKTSQTTTRIFNMLWELAGPSLFRKLFAAILTDNGPEFSDPDMIEKYRPDPEHNPTRLAPRGVRVWYADPYCSSQKPHIENFHLMLRRILQKGTSFNMLTQDGVNLTFAHLNSYPREAHGGKAPYDLFVAEHGDEGRRFLDALGIRRIPACQVTLHPFLLGQKYQQAADRAVLRKNGVTGQKKTEAGK